MTDLLLKFPNEETAGNVGSALNCASFSEGKWQFATTHKVAIFPIGAHYYPSGILNTDSILGPYPVMVSDNKFWALARIMVDMDVPEALLPFVVERNPNDAAQPQCRWA